MGGTFRGTQRTQPPPTQQKHPSAAALTPTPNRVSAAQRSRAGAAEALHAAHDPGPRSAPLARPPGPASDGRGGAVARPAGGCRLRGSRVGPVTVGLEQRCSAAGRGGADHDHIRQYAI